LTNRRPLGVPLRARAWPAQLPDCSPRTAGPQPRDVLRLAPRPGGRLRKGGEAPLRAFHGRPGDFLTDAALTALYGPSVRVVSHQH